MIFTVFKKELKETLRDRRTLITMLVIPILVFPIVLSLFMKVSKSFEDEVATKEIKIGFVLPKNQYIQNKINALPKTFDKRDISYFKDTSSLKEALKLDSIQIGVIQENELEAKLNKKETAKIIWFYNATDVGMDERAKKYASTIEMDQQLIRYRELNVDIAKVKPLESEYQNIASTQEIIGKLAGGFLPYIFIAFGFLGCMYPAIDLFTGEKERRTLETLLTVPVSRISILLGKMLVVVVSGLLASTAALVGLFITIEFIIDTNVPESKLILDIIYQILSPGFIAMLYFLLLPLVVFFAGVMIPITLRAKSFKEAQSIITPLNFIMILPAMVGFFPGIELNAITACIPVVNVVLATKDLIAGELNYALLMLSFGIMLTLAFLSIILSYKKFDQESNII